MADVLAERPGGLFESHKGYNPRVIFFYFVVAGLLVILAGGLAYQQLTRTDLYHEQEKVQNQRRVLVPGPRGNLYDRDGRLLVGNRPRFAVTLYLDELRPEFTQQARIIRKNYRDSGDKDLPNLSQMSRIARFTVVQRYLDQINRSLGRQETLDSADLNKHFRQELLLPYILVDDLTAAEYAKLIEQLPVTSPLQVYTSSIRDYPLGSVAAQTLGYVTANDGIEASEDFPGAELTTFKMKGTLGREGLEKHFDSTLQGETGGVIYRVDPSGYRVNPPLQKRQPIHGHDVQTSIDVDLQVAAETALTETEMKGSAVAIDVKTGEVLVLASKPDYDLRDFIPRLNHAAGEKITAQGAWLNRAVSGLYPPGSAFKILVTVAGMQSQAIRPDSTVNCTGYYKVGGRLFPCHDGHAHGEIGLEKAIEKSCNVFFYKYGLDTGADNIAAEARRFGLGKQTGIEVNETRGSVVPDPAWKFARREERWFPGDTANFSIGQGDLLVTPLQMATFTASFARNETITAPTLRHDPAHTPQHTAPIGLSPDYRAAIVRGMEQCTLTGTGHLLTDGKALPKIPGLRIAGKTGTAQKDATIEGKLGKINFAWFICYAPIENPQIAIAVLVEGDTPGEETGGGRYAVPVAHAILKTWSEKRQRPSGPNALISTNAPRT